MHFGITYVYHSCFIVDLGRKFLLFDYPADAHLPDGAAELVRRKIAGSELYVFISHGHDDHCNHDMDRVTAPAERCRFIVSDDVPDLFPEAVPPGASIVEPDETYAIHGMTIQTRMANDLGVAFIIDIDGLVIYFGGDLAEWIWPDMAPKAVQFTENYFQQMLDTLKQRRLHLAFANVDQRLENLGGGIKLLQEVQPDVFVPMHSFGDTAWYGKLGFDELRGASRVFLYRNTGDTMSFRVDA
jgi:glyoxylase-like metal-dependent hydrolase (beta-lactamase superfamily II)